jgi:AraC family transcriptional regulator
MNGAGFRAEYVRRMHRVVEHIDMHLAEPMLLADLAALANFSAFHFHRLFSAWMGETLGDYLWRRRLEVAAQRLITQPRTPVLNIALSVGFGSGEAFARAFKLRFACSPSQWRRLQQASRFGKVDQALGNLDQAASTNGGHDGFSSKPPLKETSMVMNVQVINRTATRVAALRYVGPYGPGVAAFWQQQFYPFLARHGLMGRPIYGISHDDPSIAAPEKCRYDTCVEVETDFVLPAGANFVTIPGGKYATLPFVGTSDTIGPAWSGLLRNWLPDSSYQLDGRPAFEYYAPGSTFDEATGTFSCDIVIPVAPLQG